MIDKLIQSWYQEKLRWWNYLLVPFTVIFAGIVLVRRTLYRVGLLQQVKNNVPVIVVGNISVGGVGKTPLVVFLAQLLKKQGFRPGIVSRGHGGDNRFCNEVLPHSDPVIVGEEAVLIARRTGCPMVTGRNRPEAVQTLMALHACDIIISDDGMQHYRLHRDIEIAVIDGARRFGNRLCLPAGPLREPVERLAEVDFIVTNGEAARGEYRMGLAPMKLQNIVDPTYCRSLDSWRGKTVHAVAAIGNPQRFFNDLTKAGLNVLPSEYPDHYYYKAKDVTFPDALPVIMTEKDAVKCLDFANDRLWSLPVQAELSDSFIRDFLARLDTVIKNKQHENSLS